MYGEAEPECFATPRLRQLCPRTTDRGRASTAAPDVGAIVPFSFVLHTYAPLQQHGGTVSPCVGPATRSCHQADRRGVFFSCCEADVGSA